MGDIADDHLDQMLADDSWAMALPRRRLAREKNQAKCAACGSTDVHWRNRGDGWKLHENERHHPGNFYPQHLCQTSAEGFEDVTDE